MIAATKLVQCQPLAWRIWPPAMGALGGSLYFDGNWSWVRLVGLGWWRGEERESLLILGGIAHVYRGITWFGLSL